MNEFNQKIIKFEYEKNLTQNDFFVTKSNQHVFKLINDWPKWEKKFINIYGEKFSGKTHLINIFLKKNNGIKIDSQSFNESYLRKVKINENIVLENLEVDINEKLFFTLLNIIEQDNKYLIITSLDPVTKINFKLKDLNSRMKNFILQNIEKPDDELIFAILLKNFSDRQISIEKKLIEFTIKRIDRSYGKIFDFIYKIDEMSLKKKKSIDMKIIKEVLGGMSE
tara:strand:- start:1271 stop:1942 length:672 start_codon:yes stop_codon:yes gene_type:complete